MKHDKVIQDLDKCISAYHSMKDLNGHLLSELLQKISSKLYYLEGVRSHYHNAFNIRVKELIEAGNSVARAENISHVEYPELYMLRHKMRASYNVTHAITMNISYLKKEMDNLG